jgi:hypothetical protein
MRTVFCASAVFIMMVSAPVSGSPFAGGTGQSDDPYQIATAEQLVSIGADPNLLSKHYVLVADIDLDPNLSVGRVFDTAVIAPRTSSGGGESPTFDGRFDGNGFRVRNLTICASAGTYVGLFGRIGSAGDVHNLRLEEVRIDGHYGVGGIAGSNNGRVSRCHVTGCITGQAKVGGLAGVNGNGSITSSSASVSISGTQTAYELGGLVGLNGGNVTNCYATGTVSGGPGGISVGGLVGGSIGIVANSYAISRVSIGADGRSVGGLVGHVGLGSVTNCFWDVEASGLSESAGGAGLGTHDMQDIQSYLAAGWDFAGERSNGTADLWLMPEAGGYPLLKWLAPGSQSHNLEGTGTRDYPYQITSPGDLGAIRDHNPSACYKLTNDIDMAGITWTTAPLGDFSGRFDGGGFAVANLTVRGGGYLGLFGTLSPWAMVEDLTMESSDIGAEDSGFHIGVLAGQNAGRISGCRTSGDVSVGDWAENVGGLVGYNSAGTISNSCAASRVRGGSECSGLGGLVGYLEQGTVSTCHASGDVVSSVRSRDLGGLVGHVGFMGDFGPFWEGLISNSYSRSRVSAGSGSERLGGLVGWILIGNIVNCYAVGGVSDASSSTTVGGLAGWNDDVVEECYFLITAGTDNGIGMPLTSEQMKQQTSFAGWDFETIWMISEGKDYPHLKWEGIDCGD